MTREPLATELDQRFSGAGAQATPWAAARRALEEAGIYWLATLRDDLRPHVTPLIGLFDGDVFYFCTGPTEQKAKNIVQNANCTVTTGCNTYSEGLDIVVEGSAQRVVEELALQELAKQYVAKYGTDWQFEVRDSAFHHEGGEAWVYEVAPEKAFGFQRGDPPSQTRWRFDDVERQSQSGSGLDDDVVLRTVDGLRPHIEVKRRVELVVRPGRRADVRRTNPPPPRAGRTSNSESLMLEGTSIRRQTGGLTWRSASLSR